MQKMSFAFRIAIIKRYSPFQGSFIIAPKSPKEDKNKEKEWPEPLCRTVSDIWKRNGFLNLEAALAKHCNSKSTWSD